MRAKRATVLRRLNGRPHYARGVTRPAWKLTSAIIYAIIYFHDFMAPLLRALTLSLASGVTDLLLPGQPDCFLHSVLGSPVYSFVLVQRGGLLSIRIRRGPRTRRGSRASFPPILAIDDATTSRSIGRLSRGWNLRSRSKAGEESSLRKAGLGNIVIFCL